MAHDGPHPHDHLHPHPHPHGTDEPPSEHLDLAVPDAELPPAGLGRRRFLQSAGLLGTAAAAGSLVGAAPAAATAPARRRVPRGGYVWLAGDHHIHTQYSPDGLYRVVDQVQHGAAYGLDWMVITDHGGPQHVRVGVERTNPDIRAARRDFPDVLVFQGLEWNIPAAEHGTVFVHPGPNEVSFLKQFESDFDGTVRGASASTPENEALAVAGLTFLQDGVAARRVRDALMLANHPSRQGVDSPHEIRAWRDTAPSVAVGMEGAPGHQAAGIPSPVGPGAGRGFYDNTPNPARAFAGYPPETYRTFGGFDWMTSTVGGLWDSLLAEGKPWWISANSDSHTTYLDTTVRGPGSDFAARGFYEDPVYGGTPNAQAGDFWPGYYSRTHVGAAGASYTAVMEGIRAGRMWVDHGGLLDGLDVRLRAGGQEVPLGGVLTARRGTPVRLVIRIDPARTPNWAQFVPRLAKVDVVRGAVTGPVGDRDVFTAPQTRVVRTWDVSGQTQSIVLTHDLGRLDDGFFVRLRGSDGNRLAVGLNGAAVDPAGPAVDVVGDADPWRDLWFYTNPMWALPSA
jgi:hypothetical protein